MVTTATMQCNAGLKGNLSHRIEPPNHIPMETNSNGADAGQLQILSCG